MKDRATTTKELAPTLFAQRLQGSRTTMMFRTLKTKNERRIRKMRAHLRRESVLRGLFVMLLVRQMRRPKKETGAE